MFNSTSQETYNLSEKFTARFWNDQQRWSRPFFDDLGQKYENRHMEIAREKSLRDANLWLLNYEALRRHDISFSDSDSDFKDWAEAKAVKCQDIARRKKLAVAWVECGDLAEMYEIDRLLVKGKDGYCTVEQLKPLIERYKDAAWWLRQIRKVSLREVEKVALSMGEIHKKNQAYCSNYAVKKRAQQKARNRHLLENLKAVNNEGDEYSIQELSDLGVSNPVVRRHELMARLNGFERVAMLYNHSALFITITCPSRYHPSSKKYDGSTPRCSQKYLSSVWARIRSKFDREGIRPYGFRIAEPHKDGCPHWHVLLFHDPAVGDHIQSIVRKYALQVDSKEAGALKNRVDFEEINLNTGSAVGYIAKYICKNIDGVFSDHAENYQGDFFNGVGSESGMGRVDVAFNCVDVDGNYIGRSDDAARRVEAWATTWGIRQFQQIGGPSVTVWRELRRMDTEEDEFDLFGGVVERARQAADSGDWAAFCIVMGGVCAPRKDHALKALMFVPHGIDKSTGELVVSAFDVTNKYGEPAAGCVLGVTALGIDYLTRFFEWEIESSKQTDNSDKAKSNWFYLLDFVGPAAPPSGAKQSALDLCQ